MYQGCQNGQKDLLGETHLAAVASAFGGERWKMKNKS